MDYLQFDGLLFECVIVVIFKICDGKFCVVVLVSLMGECVFLNDVGQEEMVEVFNKYKEVVKGFFRYGEGFDVYVDSSDIGYMIQGKFVEVYSENIKEFFVGWEGLIEVVVVFDRLIV